jgi:hypothetical protein
MDLFFIFLSASFCACAIVSFIDNELSLYYGFILFVLFMGSLSGFNYFYSNEIIIKEETYISSIIEEKNIVFNEPMKITVKKYHKPYCVIVKENEYFIKSIGD